MDDLTWEKVGKAEVLLWRSIDDAPKDGTSILGFLPQFAGFAADQRIQRCVWTGWGGGCWDCQFEKGGLGPTHYMPMPQPPADERRIVRAS